MSGATLNQREIAYGKILNLTSGTRSHWRSLVNDRYRFGATSRSATGTELVLGFPLKISFLQVSFSVTGMRLTIHINRRHALFIEGALNERQYLSIARAASVLISGLVRKRVDT